MLDLDSAVAAVEHGLRALDSGLDNIETDVHNGRLQLYGTGKVANCSLNKAVTDRRLRRQFAVASIIRLRLAASATAPRPSQA